ncbi:V-type ATP synthase subunit I [Zongyangia hominis]|uniref:V-type ATP synthase subunit I n=1 Tax=Zongyangia hominis TaxID=2763677 RepID=A0A926EAD6_9FIRM|nr:V-type ATPase 116kDa subunit family protein [Zongyangia hominis]MBC8570148.1 V-type ATP synthase subunit I [Zongyangia hominis]
MSITKMALVEIQGEEKYLDEALRRVAKSEMFQPEPFTSFSEYAAGVTAMEGHNPYSDMLRKVMGIADTFEVTLQYKDFAQLDLSVEEIPPYIDQLQSRVSALREEKKSLENLAEAHQQTLTHLRHIISLHVNFDEIFSRHFLKVRFGRLPVDSYPKLSYYEEKPFVFYSFDNDGAYHWCMYLTADEDQEEIDGIFNALFFERMWIPDYAHGTPEKAIESIQAEMAEKSERLKEVREQIKQVYREEVDKFLMIYSKLQFLSDAYDLRRNAVILRGKFHILGFIPEKEYDEFMLSFLDLYKVEVQSRPLDQTAQVNVPVKLKNNRFVRPFEMFVTMYGLPGYHDIDPTPFVAFTYTFLFGLMFGDLGQGLVISLVGWLMWKLKKMMLGRIMMRIGVSSAVFGCVYGSVFGFEHLLDPVYKMLGFAEKPIEVMAPATTTNILLVAIGLGIFIILLSMVFNIILGLKQKNLERALFSQNGLAGFIFYGAVIYAAVGTLTGMNVMNPIYVIFLIVIPLLVIFLKEPLGKMAAKRKGLFEEGVGNFIVVGFFEMFEILLSFISNTMSFLRVGGFILSHAGMMAVVLTLAEMVGAGASPLVIVIGNVFVMCMEGLIVGIQVLRLEFYEMFSRFFEAEGDPYEPMKVSYQA